MERIQNKESLRKEILILHKSIETSLKKIKQ